MGRGGSRCGAWLEQGVGRGVSSSRVWGVES